MPYGGIIYLIGDCPVPQRGRT